MIARTNQTSQPRVPLNVEGVPESLRRRPRWVCWRYEDREGKPAKVPYDPTTGKRASSTDSNTWTTFDHALDAHRSGDYAGVSYAFGTDLDIVGVDLDDCRDPETCEITSWATEIIGALDSYTEISPSGTGVKLFLAGTKSIERCRKKVEDGEVEIYDRKRFFTVTGRHLDGTPKTVEPRQAQLDALCRNLWPPEAPRPVASAPMGTLELDDQALLDRARAAKNGDAFQRLWSGDTSSHGDDDSAADMVLCGHLAFWTGCDASRMDRLFRQSGLFRGKWDEKRGPTTYGERTIRKAIDGCREVYDPRTGTAQRTSNALKKQSRLCTDVGNAARLVVKYGNRIRFCHPMGKWFIWSGTHWREDERGEILHLCKKTALSIYNEAKLAKGKRQSELAAWATASQRRERLSAMAAVAQPDVAVMPDELDANPWLFNCVNGTIDLRTGELGPHDPGDLITRVAPVEYDPDASCPRFEQFIGEIFEGDADLIDYLQRWHGYCLTGDVREQYLLIYHGEGNNGKSVLLDTLSSVMGPYASEAAPDLLVSRKQPEHPTEIADLCGRRLVVASETERDAELRVQFVKRVTGNARLKGRWMRQDYFEFTRSHKLVLVTNNRPVIRENTEAIWRRLRFVPFDYVVPPEQRDTGLMETLRAEAPGILAWLVRGCLAWNAGGLREPECVRAATGRHRGSQPAAVLEAFFDECCSFGSSELCLTTDLYARLTRWCQERGVGAPSRTDVAPMLDALGCWSKKRHGRWHWFGIGLQPATAGHGGHTGRGYPYERPCAPHEGVKGLPTSTTSSMSKSVDSSSETQVPEAQWWSV